MAVPRTVPMRIAQVSPLYESVPPLHYGGTERIVSYLTEELVGQGHEVTLFASGDSKTRARLVSPCPSALRLSAKCIDPLAHHIVMLDQVYEEASRFDIIHFHVDYLHFPMTRGRNTPNVTTLHGRLDIPDLVPIYRRFRDIPIVSISKSQQMPVPWGNWKGTVYHGLPESLYRLHEKPGRYLAFLGRISPEKGVDRAIQIAKAFGMKLKIAAKVDGSDKIYFENVIRPLITEEPLVELIGEIGDMQKQSFLGDAYALLFPIDWPEPFGLVVIEAMACGTPVIAFRNGAVPEIIADGVTGFFASNTVEAVQALHCVSSFDRARCRKAFEARFTAKRMARDYVAIYQRVLADADASLVRARAARGVEISISESMRPLRHRTGQKNGPPAESGQVG